MIASFGDVATEDLFHRRPANRHRRFPPDLQRSALRKLDMLEAAVRLEDLRALPGTRFELLKGTLAGHCSVRINVQWRLVFRWTDRGAEDVRLMDYH